MTPKSSLYRSQVFGLCGLSSSSLGKNNLARVDQSAQNESPETEKQTGNILVVLYEWGVKPEVERNILVSFRQALNRDIRSWVIMQLEELVYNRSLRSYLRRSTQTWPLRLLPPQARSAGWWLQRCCPRQETPKNRSDLVITTEAHVVLKQHDLTHLFLMRLTEQFSCFAQTHWNTCCLLRIIFTLRSLPSPLPTPEQ